MSRDAGFHDGVEKIGRYSAIDPLLDNGIKAIPGSIFDGGGAWDGRIDVVKNVVGTRVNMK